VSQLQNPEPTDIKFDVDEYVSDITPHAKIKNDRPFGDVWAYRRNISLAWFVVFSVRCNIYISRLCYDVSVRLSVRLSVTEVHWRIIANLGFKFRSKFTAHCGHGKG